MKKQSPMRPQVMWAVTNYGRLMSTHHRRREARAEAEHNTGRPWAHIREYIEIRKVIVAEAGAPHNSSVQQGES
jgi:hypothetical protein